MAPAPTYPMAGRAPPIATDCAPANKLPATTLPIPACIPAAALPIQGLNDKFIEVY